MARQIRRRVIVHGLVQGVYFRATVRDIAEAAGVSGWVRNLPDGTLEAVFEGPSATVEELVAFCRAGPPEARVARIDVVDEPPEGLAGFAVRPDLRG